MKQEIRVLKTNKTEGVSEEEARNIFYVLTSISNSGLKKIIKRANKMREDHGYDELQCYEYDFIRKFAIASKEIETKYLKGLEVDKKFKFIKLKEFEY